MSIAVTVADETVGGARTPVFALEFLDERLTARALIRARIYQEVSEYNAGRTATFRGLVQPAPAERRLNGERSQTPRRIDWEAQVERALAAFETNGFILLVDNRQIEELDEEIALRHDSAVTFLKLMPLVGG